MSADPLAARLLAIFIEELEEQLRQLNDDLAALERAPADPERLRSVFRVMHTLKGASRAAGVPLIEQLCHVLEGDLARARDRQLPLTADQRRLLLEASDALGDARERLAAGEPLAGTVLATVLQRVRGGVAAPRPVAAHPTPSVPAHAPVPVPVAVTAPAPAPASDPTSGAGEPAPAPVAEVPRQEQVRIAMTQVEAITAAAGEITVLASGLSDRATELSVLRSRTRALSPEVRHERGDLQLEQEITRLMRRAGDDARALASISGRLDNAIRHLRQRPLRDLTDTLQRVARDVARDVGKQVRLRIEGADLEADRVVIEALRDPLLHLVRNAVDHGVESPEGRAAAGKPGEGEIVVAATLRGDRLRLVLSDDGAGLDTAAIRRKLERRGGPLAGDDMEIAQRIFEDGFSTRDTATTLSGRGVGLSVVRAAAERLGGTVEVRSAAGRGATFVLEVPLSIATLRAMLVDVGGVTLAIPSAFVVRVDRVAPGTVARVDGRPVLLGDGAPVALVPLAALLGPPFTAPAVADVMSVVNLEAAGRRLAVVVDDLVDECELVLRPLEHAGRETTAVTVGTALLSSGEVVLVLGVPALLSEEGRRTPAMLASSTPERRAPAARRRILVVDDSITSRTLEQSVLAGAGYDVTTAVDGAEAWRLLERAEFDLVLSDVEMPQLDGFALCERIRASQRTAALPVILVTSLDEPAHRARGLEAGADAYIVKSSFDQDTLLDTVRLLVGREQETTQ